MGEGGAEGKGTERLPTFSPETLTPRPKFFRLEPNLASQEPAPPPRPRSGAAGAPPLYPGTEATPLPPANIVQGPPLGTQPSFTLQLLLASPRRAGI